MRFFVSVLVMTGGCFSGIRRQDFDRLEAELERLEKRSGPEVDFSKPLDLDTLIQAALRRNPELHEIHARVRGAREEIHRAGSLDDPMLKLEAEALPWNRPLSFRRDQDNMIGLAQTVPFPGKLGLRSKAALQEAEATFQEYRERERALIARLKKTYSEYFVLSKEREVHLEHVTILEGFETISESKFRTGAVGEPDVLKPQVELILLHNDILLIERKIASAQAAVNTLLYRSDDAPLGTPREIIPSEEHAHLNELQTRAVNERPELQAALLRHTVAQTQWQLAEKEATFPDLSIGMDYWQIPEERDAWGGMVSINLPWFTGKRSAEVRKLSQEVRAAEFAVGRIRSRILYEVREAFLRVEAGRKSALLLKEELLPKSNQSAEVSGLRYKNDQASFLDLLDAERSLRDVKLRYYQSLAEYESARADLEYAIGGDLRRNP